MMGNAALSELYRSAYSSLMALILVDAFSPDGPEYLEAMRLCGTLLARSVRLRWDELTEDGRQYGKEALRSQLAALEEAERGSGREPGKAD